MKMTYRKTAFIGLWAGMIFASCSSDEDMITGKTLPQGKYPVAMTVSVESLIARSSVDGTWTNGEKVTVQAITKTGDAYNWNDAVSYPYEINNDIPAALTKKKPTIGSVAMRQNSCGLGIVPMARPQTRCPTRGA